MANLVQTLVQRNFNLANGELCVGKLPVTRLAREYGTPLFAYDLETCTRKYAQLRAALPRQFSICYSVKANPNPAVLRHFLSLGCGLEIASAGEFRRGVEAGCEPAKMLFAGPGKTESELELVLSSHIGEIHLESETEARRVSAISRRLGMRARVAIRVNPAGEAEGGAMRMGGRPAPFGIDEEQLEGLLDLVLRDASLTFRGIHLFTGTQILDAKVLLTQYRHGLKIARKVAQIAGVPLERLDFGGGLGIPYFAHEEELNLEHLRGDLAALFDEVGHDPAFRGTEFLVEPGRFLAGEAGIYIARVIDIKVSRGKKFLIVDGGMNHHLAASGNLGQTIKRNYPVALLNKLDGTPTESVDVVGPLCTPLDTLARNVDLPHAEIGDLFGIFQSGAYGFSASPLGFLSHASPAEVVVHSGEATLAGHRGSASEVLLGSSTQH
jgi:diaminopimelate decarboxylase